MNETEIKITPIGKPRMTQSDKWAGRKVVKNYFGWCNAIRLLFKDELKGSYEIEFIIPFPKSYSNKKRLELIGQPHQIKPDLDNLLKAFNDALAKEDSYIHTIKASKKWGRIGKIIIRQ